MSPIQTHYIYSLHTTHPIIHIFSHPTHLHWLILFLLLCKKCSFVWSSVWYIYSLHTTHPIIHKFSHPTHLHYIPYTPHSVLCIYSHTLHILISYIFYTSLTLLSIYSHTLHIFITYVFPTQLSPYIFRHPIFRHPTHHIYILHSDVRRAVTPDVCSS